MRLCFDFKSPIPLYLQLRNQIVNGIAEGELKFGEKLPSVRALAEESGINAMTVSKAYQLLKQEGYIVTDRRRGAQVSWKKGDTGLPEETVQNLRLCLSELRLSGMSRKEVMELCLKLYEEGKA